MPQDFSKIIEDYQKQIHRKNLHRIWTKATSGELNSDDKKIAEIMMEHEEFHDQFDIANELLDHEYDPNTEVNPFVHIDVHLAVEDQLESGEPVETEIFIETMEAKGINRHEAIHCVGMILTRMAYEAIQKLDYFDLYKYKELLDKLKDVEPSEMEVELEMEFKNNLQ